MYRHYAGFNQAGCHGHARAAWLIELCTARGQYSNDAVLRQICSHRGHKLSLTVCERGTWAERAQPACPKHLLVTLLLARFHPKLHYQ
jgi:hypothetical protein